MSHVVYGLSRALRNNAALARERQQNPEIEREAITRPVFIVGINRTGTTFLHRLLARDPRFWALRRYELTEPVLPSGDYATVAGTVDDPRRAYAEELLGLTNVVDTLAGVHRTDIDEPEEDLWILMLTFSTWLFTAAYHVPALWSLAGRNGHAPRLRAPPARDAALLLAAPAARRAPAEAVVAEDALPSDGTGGAAGDIPRCGLRADPSRAGAIHGILQQHTGANTLLDHRAQAAARGPAMSSWR